MGIRLIFLVISLFISCSSSKNISDAVGGVKESDYVKIYKTAFFCGCLNGLTDNNFSKELYTKYNDIALYSEVSILGHAISDEAVKLGETYAKSIKPVDMPDVEGRRDGFSSCVYYTFYGNKVDSIAKRTYRKYKHAKLFYIDEKTQDTITIK